MKIERQPKTYGIQGGNGSFNEEALLAHLKTSDVQNYQIQYLYTTENVLAALEKGEIDYGQFAIHNSIGGLVDESLTAMGKHKFEVVEQYSINISHALMINNGQKLTDIKLVMAHPQVFAQCKKNMLRKYPNLKLISGEGELIDHANVARHLHEGKLSADIGVMGSKVLAQLYGLTIVEDNLQDLQENKTIFLLVARDENI